MFITFRQGKGTSTDVRHHHRSMNPVPISAQISMAFMRRDDQGPRRPGHALLTFLVSWMLSHDDGHSSEIPYSSTGPRLNIQNSMTHVAQPQQVIPQCPPWYLRHTAKFTPSVAAQLHRWLRWLSAKNGSHRNEGVCAFDHLCCIHIPGNTPNQATQQATETAFSEPCKLSQTISNQVAMSDQRQKGSRRNEGVFVLLP